MSGFDQSGAVVTNGKKEEKVVLIIPAEKNRDWREESRKKRRKNPVPAEKDRGLREESSKKKGKNLLPAEVQAASSGKNEELKAAQVDRDEVSKQSGISFVQKDEDGDTTMAMAEDKTSQKTLEQVAKVPKTQDEEALEALLGGERISNLVLPALEDDRDGYTQEDTIYEDYTNEDDRFKADVASRPDVSTLDEYAAIPVDGFGAGLLRGMGWKDGDSVGKRRTQGTTSASKPRVVERRPALLGIGAKEVPTGVGDDELGAWGKGAKGKRKTDLTYNPVILKNSVTGEMLTEEELEKKKKLELNGNGKGQEDWRERRDRNLAIDGRRKEERRERLLIEENGNSSSRHSSSRRERSRSKERSSHNSSSRRRSRSRDRSHHHGSSRRERSPHGKSSRRDRSRSDERRHRRY